MKENGKEPPQGVFGAMQGFFNDISYSEKSLKQPFLFRG